MADNFLERHYEDYEARKAAYLRKKKHLPKKTLRLLERPEDEALYFLPLTLFSYNVITI